MTSSDLIIFWHRRDLRLDDHYGLTQARSRSRKIVGVFCFDPKILAADDIAPARIQYLLGSLACLAQNYSIQGGNLLFFFADPCQLIPELAQKLSAKAVYWSEDVEPYARSRDKIVQDSLKEKGIEYVTHWEQLLHRPGQVLSQSQTPYTVFTPFWKNWNSLPKEEPLPSIENLEGLTIDELETINPIALPTAKDLGYCWDKELPLIPGEQAALEILEAFCQNHLENYGQSRNFPSINGTSLLGPALKFGVIGLRRIWQTSQNISLYSRSDEARQSITTWQQELAWREFYQHCLYYFPALVNGPYRAEFQNFPWQDKPEYFQAWCTGNTGYPIVDAAMRQLNETGWMHNRCRMIVASFLTKDLILNWQWGEKYFMQKLVDGDLSANNGGWQWSASSGMDPKPLRIFNPYTQAQRFDPEGDYIRRWLPELSSIDTVNLLSGKIPPLERMYCNYPEPIVVHNEQQKKFKILYQEQKQKT